MYFIIKSYSHNHENLSSHRQYLTAVLHVIHVCGICDISVSYIPDVRGAIKKFSA